MSDIKIRPHHALCTAFFEGKGYSEEFVENMYKVANQLSQNPQVCLTNGFDVLCKACPSRTDGSCSAQGKADSYDEKVLEICGIVSFSRLLWDELSNLVWQKIIAVGRLGEVCADCKWFEICSHRVKRR